MEGRSGRGSGMERRDVGNDAEKNHHRVGRLYK